MCPAARGGHHIGGERGVGTQLPPQRAGHCTQEVPQGEPGQLCGHETSRRGERICEMVMCVCGGVGCVCDCVWVGCMLQ